MYNLLEDEKVNAIINELDTNALKLDKIGFNIFSISRYGSHLENFHSDILAKLLDTKAEHEEGDLFLKTFYHDLQI
ncbi:hypothetical protein NBRC110019_03750 [Neptunitalea chrysea]|uniref:Uncharacterized protein n=1 Tax=Neptunitalea chrysea TaxID=1647581 RepID=A0A9W6EU72_9FLAO|nr:PD-(D/E)XK nuclease family protein [Neptunitalea chrysea]GLB51336.1 hypothetical protein NBRC110019_03750 [Neptunitalea chrysea]